MERLCVILKILGGRNMSTVGLIVEYNPFHNGHLHHIKESLRITGADNAVVVMSGDFVQRGAPAIIPKHLRTQMALDSGAAMVIELPVRYATGSAEFFATGAVSLLHELGCVDYLCFGSESGDILGLSQIANILIDEPADFKNALQMHLKSGLSFPNARQLALEEYLHKHDYDPNLCNILSEPNNILGIEYLKSLKNLDSKIKPFTITRKTSHYHDTKLTENCSSASAIRAQLNDVTSITDQIPIGCFDIIKENYGKRFPIHADDFSLLLHAKLLEETPETLMKYEDMSMELANRIINNRNKFVSIEQFIPIIKSKNITHARISRVLFHIILNIQNKLQSPLSPTKKLPLHYIHILGFRKNDAQILTHIKQNSNLPIITKLTNQEALDSEGKTMLMEDVHASNLYESVVTNKFNTPFIHELEKSLIF